METTQVRDIDGNTFSLDDKDRVTNTLQEYGVLVICGQSSVSYETNSLNAAHAVQRGGFLGVTTPECIKTSNILHPDVATLLFLFFNDYEIGTTYTLIPVPIRQSQPPEILILRAFTATHFADNSVSDQMFRVSLDFPRGKRVLDLRGGDILFCLKEVRRSIPYITTPAPNKTVVVTDTHYYPSPDNTDTKVQPELLQRYLEIGKGELNEVDRKVIWSKDRFNARLPPL